MVGFEMKLAPIEASKGPGEATVTRVPIRVRFGETDLMGIAHHGSYLLYVEEARVEYLAKRGVTYAEWVQRGMHFAVIDARVRYRQASLFHDNLVVETWIGSHSRVGIRFDYRIWRGETLIAEAETTLVCVDDQRTPRRISQEILDIVLGPERA
jgi:acyl-CoA thioester hydrolase